MLAYVALGTLTLNALVGLKMAGTRLPTGVLLTHGSSAVITLGTWIAYLLLDRPPTLAWAALLLVVAVNGFGDVAVVRKWKRKEDGGLGLIGTYVKRIKRPILLAHAAGGGLNVAILLLVALGY